MNGSYTCICNQTQLMKQTEISCDTCGTSFLASRKARFCSNKCRVKAYKNRHDILSPYQEIARLQKENTHLTGEVKRLTELLSALPKPVSPNPKPDSLPAAESVVQAPAILLSKPVIKPPKPALPKAKKVASVPIVEPVIQAPVFVPFTPKPNFKGSSGKEKVADLLKQKGWPNYYIEWVNFGHARREKAYNLVSSAKYVSIRKTLRSLRYDDPKRMEEELDKLGLD